MRAKKATAAMHCCGWPGCPVKVELDLWGCKHHWFTLPREVRQAIWKAYRRGQTVWTASPEYLAAITAAAKWIRQHTLREGQLPL